MIPDEVDVHPSEDAEDTLLMFFTVSCWCHGDMDLAYLVNKKEADFGVTLESNTAQTNRPHTSVLWAWICGWSK